MPNIREMQRRLSQWATDHPGERYHDLYNLVCQSAWLRQAYGNVAQNKGAKTPGIDRMTQPTWERHLEENLERLRIELREGKYEPQPCRRVYIPKKDGKLRPLGIPTFRDRTVQEAVRMAIEPIFEADFVDTSHGFRPHRSTQDAMVAVRTYMINRKRMYYVIEGDIKGCFDAIHHKKLMTLLKRRIADKRLLNVIWLFLKSGVMEDGLFTTIEHGTPQGGVISPLLANVYLHELDRFHHKRFTNRTPWEREKCRKHGGNNAGYVRYADDFVYLCNGHIEDVRKLKEEVASYLSDELHLTLSEEKTIITHVNDGFEFLGFRFFRGRDREGKWKPKTAIPQSKIESVKENIRRLTERDHTYMDEAAVVARLNAVLRGWGNYYRHMPAVIDFRKVDHYAFQRLVRWYRHKYHWKTTEVLKRRYTRDAGNRRLFAEWDSSTGRKRVTLVVLTRDIRRYDYNGRKIGNPYLAES
jgi:RNA-directed DNA polymerase